MLSCAHIIIYLVARIKCRAYGFSLWPRKESFQIISYHKISDNGFFVIYSQKPHARKVLYICKIGVGFRTSVNKENLTTLFPCCCLKSVKLVTARGNQRHEINHRVYHTKSEISRSWSQSTYHRFACWSIWRNVCNSCIYNVHFVTGNMRQIWRYIVNDHCLLCKFTRINRWQTDCPRRKYRRRPFRVVIAWTQLSDSINVSPQFVRVGVDSDMTTSVMPSLAFARRARRWPRDALWLL